MPTDPVLTWLTTTKDLGVVAILLVLLYGGAKRWWAFGYQLVDARADCDRRVAEALAREEEWKEIARATGRVAETVVDVAKARGRA